MSSPAKAALPAVAAVGGTGLDTYLQPITLGIALGLVIGKPPTPRRRPQPKP